MHQDGRDGVARTLFRAGRDPPRRRSAVGKAVFPRIFFLVVPFFCTVRFFLKKKKETKRRERYRITVGGPWGFSSLFFLIPVDAPRRALGRGRCLLYLVPEEARSGV